MHDRGFLLAASPQQPSPQGETMTDTKAMHKRRLIQEACKRPAYRQPLTQEQMRVALHALLDVIADEMAEGNAVTIAGFGRFEAKEHAGRQVQGMDGETYQVESRLVPSFKPYDSLRERVQGKASWTFTRKPRPTPLRWSEDPNS